jgi:hypothetical protein
MKRTRIGLMASLTGAFLLTGCAANAPTPTVITVTATPPPATRTAPRVTFNPATSGKLLAGRVAKKAADTGITVTGVECRNFPDIKVGTHADCQMRVNGVKQGIRATFVQRDGHYVLKAQKLTWK